ncbi:conserved hypothetical protein [Trichinella spiralis]|uniref:hypothetical protein n=1 Tax=Trichinella spiralis TaxID=6334 RepID=UPI0001EFB3D4|nr:conserved hypothetical protein [Trichinella spiralis]
MATGRVLIGTGQQGRQLFISKIDHRPEMVLTDETWTTERQSSYNLSANAAKNYINIQSQKRYTNGTTSGDDLFHASAFGLVDKLWKRNVVYSTRNNFSQLDGAGWMVSIAHRLAADVKFENIKMINITNDASYFSVSYTERHNSRSV